MHSIFTPMCNWADVEFYCLISEQENTDYKLGREHLKYHKPDDVGKKSPCEINESYFLV